jgi:hypothetical protein
VPDYRECDHPLDAPAEAEQLICIPRIDSQYPISSSDAVNTSTGAYPHHLDKSGCDSGRLFD